LFNSVLRYYDEAVIEYFKDIEIHDGVELRTPQIQFSIPSTNGYKLIKDNENRTPILPMIVITRTNIAPNSATPMIKKSAIRPRILNLNSNTKTFDGIEILYYNLQYKIMFFSLTREMHNSILEQLAFKLYQDHYIKAHIEILNHNIQTNNYISDISINDSTGYEQIEDTAERVFIGDASFILDAKMFKAKKNVSSVLVFKEIGKLVETNQIIFEQETS
jgi:hypothetical protein